MADAIRYWMPDDVRELPDDGNRYECIDGQLLVTPSPRTLHQRALRELLERILPYVKAQQIGELLWSPADIEIEPGTLVQPDLFVVAPPETGKRIAKWPDVRRLVLAVEALSPTTARYDRGIKRDFYRRAPVDEYWIVDIADRLIERWRHGAPEPEVARDTLVWQPPGASEPLAVNLVEYFAALGD